MNVNNFFAQIKDNPECLYLLYGVEEYAKDRALEALLATVDTEFAEFNSTVLENPTAQSIIVACEALPLMDKRRVVVIKNSSFFGKAKAKESDTKEDAGVETADAKELMAYLCDICPTTTLCFFERGLVDTRKTLFKAIAKADDAINFEPYSNEEAAKWAATYAKRQGTKLGANEARQLVMMIGNNLSDVAAETEKLCAFVGEGQITGGILEKYVHRNLEYSVFIMLEHFIAGRLDKGFALLHQTLRDEGRGGAIKTLMFFASRLRGMLQARRALDAGLSMHAAVAEIGGNPYAAKKTIESVKHFSLEQLENAVLNIAAADYDIKSGKKKDVTALEEALVRIFARS